MTSCREQLRDAGRVETRFRKAEGCSKTSTTGTTTRICQFILVGRIRRPSKDSHNNGVVLMLNQGILS